MTRQHPEALPHGEVTELLPDVFFVTGTIELPLKVKMAASRNMVVLRDGDDLTLVNTVRLNEAGLSQLDALGKVRHIIRLAGFHGMDDPFYKERYDATLWSVDAPYVRGFDQNGRRYLTADKIIKNGIESPVRGSQFIVLESASPSEGLLHLDRDGGILISGDCLQNWAKPDRYFNFAALILMRLFGFIKPHNVGPGWLKNAGPDIDEVKSLGSLTFDKLLPSHGSPVMSGAQAAYAKRLEKL